VDALLNVVHAADLMVLPVAAQASSAVWRPTQRAAALFCFFACATCDLTNLSNLSNLITLKNWPAGLPMIDIAWGAFVGTVSAAAGRAACVALTRPE